MKFVFQQGFAEGLLDFALAGGGGLPAIKSDQLHDLVDVVDDAFDDGGGLVGLECRGTVRSGRLWRLLLLLFAGLLFFGFDGFLG